MRMRVAVTGASGFIGRHAVRALVARGAEVIAVSRHPDAAIDPAVTPLAYDIGMADADTFERIGRPDVLLHLAWGGLPHYRAASHLELQLPRQVAFLEACARAGLQRLVVAGTCLEYGMQSGCLDETMPALPITAYGQAKDHLRRHLHAIASTGGLQLTWLRLFYVYGPGQAPTSLYSQLRAAIAAGATDFPMSPGDQQRDFLPIETATDYLCRFALGVPREGIINVCRGVPESVVARVREWLGEWHADLHLELGVYPYPDYEPHTFWGSTRKLDALLETI
jgi:nucleoside-diphosphate-sugar epimerase